MPVSNELRKRAFKALNLEQYSEINKVDDCGDLELEVPQKRQYILRMLVKRMFDNEYRLPDELAWIKPLIDITDEHQKLIGVRQPFVYVTIRNGIVDSLTDDEWHVDGFSQTITHLPEQNYLWTNIFPTEYVEKAFDFPDDFDGLVYNIHNFFQNRIKERDVITMKEKRVYGFDPYIVHRRPKISNGINRCFIRISYTPIEIEDLNNTQNPLLPTNYKRDGVKEMRNRLVNYDIVD
jgi:hypothetical protein